MIMFTGPDTHIKKHSKENRIMNEMKGGRDIQLKIFSLQSINDTNDWRCFSNFKNEIKVMYT